MRTKNIIVFGAFSAIGVGLLLSQDVFSHYEEPDYQVVLKEGAFEIRKYPALISAEVTVEAGKNSDNEAFKILAGYIFGKNKSQKKIAMTIPVTMEKAAPHDRYDNKSARIAMTTPVTSERIDDKLIMRFFMPSKYKIDTLPEPLNNQIVFKEVPPQTFAVLRFSGFLNEKNTETNKLILRHFLEKNSYTTRGNALSAAYNPPWTLPFLRRNEIWIAIEAGLDNSKY